jgi:hypothetical protein
MDGLLPRWTIGKHCFQCPLNTTTFPPNGSSAFCLSRHASPQSPAVLSRPSVGVVAPLFFRYCATAASSIRSRRLLSTASTAFRCCIDTWGDNSVSSCRSYRRAKGPGASAEAFTIHPMALSVLGGVPRGPVGPPRPLELAALIDTSSQIIMSRSLRTAAWSLMAAPCMLQRGTRCRSTAIGILNAPCAVVASNPRTWAAMPDDATAWYV